MHAHAIIAMQTNDYPKIKPTATGAEVTFELYDISLDELRNLSEQELTIIIEPL